MGQVIPFRRRKWFEPELLADMGAAHDRVCSVLSGPFQSARLEEHAAHIIVALVIDGERDPATLYRKCLWALDATLGSEKRAAGYPRAGYNHRR